MGIIRLILALSVVAIHCGGILGNGFVGGQVAVESFYIISGFYMSLILNEKYVRSNNSYKLFITNRFLRLYPIYWAVLVLTIGACFGAAIVSKGSSIPKIENYQSVEPGFLSFSLLFFSNILVFFQDWIMFLGINPNTGHLFFTKDFTQTVPTLHSFLFIPQAWTLGLELTFYVIAPFLLKKGVRTVIMLIVASLGLRFFLFNYYNLQHDPWTYRFFPTEIMFFLLGFISYKEIYLRIRTFHLSQNISFFILFSILLFSLCFSYLPDSKLPFSPFSNKEWLYFLSMALAIPFLFNSFKNNKLDNQIGELSYPVYISHMLVAMVFGNLGIEFLKSGLVIALVTIVFSLLLNKFISVPIEHYRQSRLKHQTSPVKVKSVQLVAVKENVETNI